MTANTFRAEPRRPHGRTAPGRAFVFDKPCYVYLAVHRAGQRFKIGLSIDPLSRFQQLPEAGDIDLTVTLVRRLPSKARALQVERSLHRALDPHRLLLEQRGDGYTEWFRMEAFQRAGVMIDAMPDAVPPAEALARQAGDRQRNEYVRVAEANVVQVTKALAIELAFKGIRVNAIAPGWIVTEMNDDYLNSEAGAKIKREVPMGRFGNTGDLDGALLLLASDAGAYMAGATIVVDGGQVVQIKG